MRWQNLRLDDGTNQPVLIERGAVTRTFDTPGFRGITFHEVQARSLINEVPGASRVPFRYTINPYRGCSHGCVGCFARNTHTYLNLDSGQDFNSQVVVKVNAPDLVRRELARPQWRRDRAGAAIAMGTNVDCYQRAEGRYRLMPGIIAALRDERHPFSILTRGPLLLRDLELLGDAAQHVEVSLAVSVPFVDRDLARSFEPGAASPPARLRICSRLEQAGLGCAVLMAPILPFLSDSPRQLEATVAQLAAAGARSITPIVLHLRPGAREWYFTWLRQHHPDLVGRYEELYRGGAYAPKSYQRRITEQVRELAERYGVTRRTADAHRRVGTEEAATAPAAARPTQLSLL
ncbi:Rv2578c family radical SAM protein [Lipingzhangella sp. LS1_29]|uniref:Rv2578c family radical SAM protein n=1 Tax=Lipingzhangella rawalii TaxID=2055835 RepID=A0ABU2H230_9ACTN|nr:Rv2578c family radical SAM protein [Lipingzhangella rawalii]MDS1269057.1 Rv2578c family radical SAM protein [Lipingzhangella rawalii]